MILPEHVWCQSLLCIIQHINNVSYSVDFYRFIIIKISCFTAYHRACHSGIIMTNTRKFLSTAQAVA